MPPATVIRQAAVVAGTAVAIVGLGALATWFDLDAQERAVAAGLATPQRIAVLALLATALVAALAGIAWRWHLATTAPARRLAESLRLATTNPGHRTEPSGAPEMRELAAAVNAFAGEHAALRVEMESRVAAARADLEAEKNRLAALMSELRSSVIVCNAEGRILLYNAAARRLLGGPDGERIGLGRSVFGALDRALVLHALAGVERQIAQTEAEPTAQFVAAGEDARLVRVTLAPVLAHAADAQPSLGGFVLVCADITETIEQGTRRDGLLQSVTESARGALANMRAAIENLIEYPDMSPERRARFSSIIRDEALRLSERLESVTREFSEAVKSQWPLEEMRGEDLVAVASARVQARLGLPTKLEDVDPSVWVRVDSFSVAQALAYLASRLVDEFSVREVRFRLTRTQRHAQFDVLWTGAPLSPETAFAWENDPFTAGGETSPLTLRSLIERHHGEIWYTRDRPSQSAYYRLVLPLADVQARVRTQAPAGGRPEFYDFDLFRSTESTRALDDRRLAELTFTVFDTETTGLDPSGGDEIVSIGAVRIVNGRLLHGETFESLIDPRRGMSPESIAVHGIAPELLAGQPTVEEVLPRFHRFAADTVLVAHNAAFDMRFLQLKEEAAGVRFDQPVLDTLLLSAVCHPNQEGHSLEAIAERLGLPVVGRHTALGDAIVTGEAFLRLLPLLEKQGIRTLGEAREASARTFFARVSY